MQTHFGQVIGAAEGNKEMKDRHQGFGAYDVPFLGPSRQNQEKEAEQVPYSSRSCMYIKPAAPPIFPAICMHS